ALFSRSLSVNGFSLNSGYTAETNAIFDPSGDQIAFPAPVLMFVICFGSPPAAGTTYNWPVPERFDSKRIVLPSRDQFGFVCLFPIGSVSCFGGRFPSVSAT